MTSYGLEMSESDLCSNRLKLDIISILVNLSCELGQIGGSFERQNPKWGLKV